MWVMSLAQRDIRVAGEGGEYKGEREREKDARKWRKVSDAVVHRDARWKRESCHNGRESSITWDAGGFAKDQRTFENFDSFNRLVIYGAGALFDELIAFRIEDVRALHE
jgi:hypothetical protein